MLLDAPRELTEVHSPSLVCNCKHSNRHGDESGQADLLARASWTGLKAVTSVPLRQDIRKARELQNYANGSKVSMKSLIRCYGNLRDGEQCLCDMVDRLAGSFCVVSEAQLIT